MAAIDDKRLAVKRKRVEEMRASEATAPLQEPTTFTDAVKGVSESAQGLQAGFEEAMPLSGLLDKAGAGLYAGAQEVGDVFRSPENQKDFGQRYDETLALQENLRKKATEKAPISSAVGNVAGAASTLALPVPGAGIGGVAGAVARVAGGAGLAALDVGTQDRSKIINPEMALQAGTLGAGLGAAGETLGAIPKLFPKTSAAISEMPGKVSNYFETNKAERALKASGIENISSLRKYAGIPSGGKFNPERVDALKAKDAIPLLQSEEGARPILGWFTKPEDITKELSARRSLAGQEIGSVAKKIDQAHPDGIADTFDIATALHSYAEELPTTGGGKNVSNLVKKEADEILKLPRNLSFEQLQDIKNSYKYQPTALDSVTSNKDATNYIKSLIGKKMDEAAGRAEGLIPGLSEEYTKAKGKYGTYERLSTASANSAEAAKARRMFSPSDYGIAAVAGGSSAVNDPENLPAALAKGVIAGAAHKQFRERGPAFAAKSYEKLANILGGSVRNAERFTSVLSAAAKNGSIPLAAAHAMLMKKEPEYRQAVSKYSSEETP